jgi:starvation-inducible DNA-binding protein
VQALPGLVGARRLIELARSVGSLHSMGDISKHQRLKDNDAENVSPKEMLAELDSDNQALTRYFRSAHEACEKHNSVATASMIEIWIDRTERRAWFPPEMVQGL